VNQILTVPLVLLLVLPLRMRAAGGPIPDYKVGETSAVEVVSPVHLIVIDHERTEKLRQQEAQREPAIFRFNPDAYEEIEAGFRAAFAEQREKFRDLLEENYSKRILNEAGVAHPRFQRLVASFQQQSRPFPLATNLAQIWAMGGSDEVIVTNLTAPLREMMSHYIRIDSLPPEGRNGPRQVRMIPVKPKEAAIELPAVAAQATNIYRTNIYALTRARKDLQTKFPLEERAFGRFLAGFLKENCSFDAELTSQARKKRTD